MGVASLALMPLLEENHPSTLGTFPWVVAEQVINPLLQEALPLQSPQIAAARATVRFRVFRQVLPLLCGCHNLPFSSLFFQAKNINQTNPASPELPAGYSSERSTIRLLQNSSDSIKHCLASGDISSWENNLTHGDREGNQIYDTRVTFGTDCEFGRNLGAYPIRRSSGQYPAGEKQNRPFQLFQCLSRGRLPRFSRPFRRRPAPGAGTRRTARVRRIDTGRQGLRRWNEREKGGGAALGVYSRVAGQAT